MAKEKRQVKSIISDNIGEAAAQLVADGLDAGFDIEEIAPDTGPKLRAKGKFNQECFDELINLTSQGAAIPGQSLTNDPEQPYAWEKPPEFANPREALDDITASILQPEAIKNLVPALAKGAAVSDIANAILYTKFTEGKITADTMMLLAEPVMYTIMAIGEEANSQYNIEKDDADEFDDNVEDEDEVKANIDNFRNVFTDIKNGTLKNMDTSKVDTNAVPQSILAQVKTQGPEIRSLLSKGDE